MAGSSFHDRILIDDPHLRKELYALSGMAPKAIKGLEPAAHARLLVSLESSGLSALVPLCRPVQQVDGFCTALDYCRLLVHDFGTPAPAAQLLPPMAFAAIRTVVENPSSLWDPTLAAQVRNWAPVLFSFIAAAKASPDISPEEVAAILCLLLERAEAAFPLPPLPEGASLPDAPLSCNHGLAIKALLPIRR